MLHSHVRPIDNGSGSMLVFRGLISFFGSLYIHWDSQTGDAQSSCPMSELAWAERGVEFHARPVDKQCDHCLFSRWVNVFFIHFFLFIGL